MTIKKKVVLLGESSVGKTSLVRRFVFDAFEDHYVATIGGKVSRKDLQLERPNGTTNVALMVWDLIGREGYVGFHARTFAGTSGAILVADLTRRDTLESLEKYWIPLLVKVAGPIPVVVAGNKSDLPERAFGAAELATLGSQFNPEASRALPANLETNYLTSAKTGSNVEKAFE